MSGSVVNESGEKSGKMLRSILVNFQGISAGSSVLVRSISISLHGMETRTGSTVDVVVGFRAVSRLEEFVNSKSRAGLSIDPIESRPKHASAAGKKLYLRRRRQSFTFRPARRVCGIYAYREISIFVPRGFRIRF